MKGLFILFNFTKQGSASSIQNLRLVQGLINSGADIDIVTQENSYSIDNLKIFNIKSNSTRILNSILFRLFPDLGNLPDMERYFWSKKVIKNIENLINVKNYGWVHTTGSPQSTHFIGKYLKDKYQIPWVAQFYDPWFDNNFKRFTFSVFKNLDLKMEGVIANNANLIIHTNHVILDKWKLRYGDNISKKMVEIPLCTDENIENFPPNSTNENLIILHVGSIHGDRKITLLLESLKILKKENLNLFQKLEIHLVGFISKKEKNAIFNSNLNNIFRFIGRVKYNDIHRYVKNADILLLLDNLVEENYFFPSKICEYFSYQKPIIGIVPQISVGHKLLFESNHFYVFPGETKKLYSYLKSCLEIGIKNLNFDRNYYKNFDPNFIAHEYMCQIRILK